MFARCATFPRGPEKAARSSSSSPRWLIPATPCRSSRLTPLHGQEGAVPELQEIAKDLSIADHLRCLRTRRRLDLTIRKFSSTRRARSWGVIARPIFSPGLRLERTNASCPASELKSFPFGRLRLGLSICYDLRFPEVYRTLAIEQGANVFVLSSAWPFPRMEHFQVLGCGAGDREPELHDCFESCRHG